MRLSYDQSRISFTSDEPFFTKEKNGIKTNTVRQLGRQEIDALMNAVFHIQDIEMICDDRSFTRLLCDISYYDDRFIFSWQHREE